MSDNDKWLEIMVLTTHEAVEAVSAIFYDAGVAGVAIEDPKDIINSNSSVNSWDYIDNALMPQDTEEVKVKGYLLFTDSLNGILEYIKNSVEKLNEYGLDKGKGEVYVSEVREQDWANAWKEYYKPFKIGDKIVIKPSWENYDAQQGDIVIELDPGMAFGTGTHETTRMCVELLQKHVKNDSVVFDIGCGSGILSIVSSKLGAERVVGVDIDEVAVRSSMENIKISKVDNVDIKQGNLFDVIEGRSDIVVANIIADVIINICPRIHEFLKSSGVFISSGIIKDRSEDVKKALLNNNFNIIEVKELGEWVAIAVTLKE